MAKIEGDAGDNRLNGGADADRIFGYAGDDTLNGFSGDDLLEGGAGRDLLMADGSGGASDDDRVFGGAGDDLIFGGYGADLLSGGQGDDVIGLDYLAGGWTGDAPDTVDGGRGFDQIHIDADETAREIALSLSGSIVIDGQVAAIASDFESASFRGGSGDHKVTGTAGDDFIEGGVLSLFGFETGGDDTFIGGAGRDTIRGGSGADLIVAGAGDDVVHLADGGRDRVLLGAGDDMLTLSQRLLFGTAPVMPGGRYDGGEGYDIFDLDLDAFGGGDFEIAFDGAELTIDGRVLATLSGFEAIDIDGLRVVGLAGDDTIGGEFGRNRLFGRAGDDEISVSLDARRDLLKGGAGTDLLDFDGSGGAVVMTGDLASGVTITIDGVEAAFANGFERLDASGSDRNDSFLGGSGDDDIAIGIGRDVVRTFGGDDQISIDLDLRTDLVNLGAGTDLATLRYDGDLDVVMSAGDRSVDVGLGDRTAAVVIGAEQYVVFAGAGDDRLLGGDGADRLSGDAGRNTLSGRGGDDVLVTVLDGRADHVRGGGGTDQLIVLFDGDEVEVPDGGLVTEIRADGDFTISIGGKVVIDARSIETIHLTDTSEADLMIGQSGDDQLISTFGPDTLIGGAGDDILVAGITGGLIDGGEGFDTASFAGSFFGGLSLTLAAGGTVTATLNGTQTFDLSGVENVVGTVYADTIVGDDGDNVIEGFGGGDSLDGGAGTDTISFATRSEGFLIDLAAGVSTTLDFDSGSSDVIRNFENVIGSDARDRIVGDDGDNRIDGGDGGDDLTGGRGADVFVFGDADSRFEAEFGLFDRIADFSSPEGDRIDLTGFVTGSPALAFIGSEAFSGRAGEARFEADAFRTKVLLDLDGDFRADKTIVLSGAHDLTLGDFILA